MTPSLTLLLLTGALVGAASGYLGSFMVLKRMSLVGDALSHVALPGLAIALMLHFDPILGAFTALTLAAIGIWYFQNHSTIYPDALVGIFFTASLAIGLLITPQPELLEALFGNIQNLNLTQGIMASAISLLLIFLTYKISKPLILTVLSEDLAKTTGLAGKYTQLVYLLLVATVVALGVKFVGTLLTGALVIIPAAAAKNLSRSLAGYSLWSIVFGCVSSVLGVFIASVTHSAPGPIVILTSVALFLLSHFFRLLRHN
jgi:ABC-type Mn2+/Zn2+ transport system permease subunit